MASPSRGWSGRGYEDNLGHGTAVAAIIYHLNPDADLVAVKIFDGKLATSLRAVIRAIDWCLDHDIQVINLSLGTLNPEYRSAFEDAVERTHAARAVIVSALEMNGDPAVRGSLAGCWQELLEQTNTRSLPSLRKARVHRTAIPARYSPGYRGNAPI